MSAMWIMFLGCFNASALIRLHSRGRCRCPSINPPEWSRHVCVLKLMTFDRPPQFSWRCLCQMPMDVVIYKQPIGTEVIIFFVKLQNIAYPWIMLIPPRKFDCLMTQAFHLVDRRRKDYSSTFLWGPLISSPFLGSLKMIGNIPKSILFTFKHHCAL